MANQGAAPTAAATASDFMYDVFLSFKSGYAFADHLYQSLLNVGIKTFKDDDPMEQRGGDETRPDLLDKIENSRMSIVVFCKDYASSARCLDGLAKIVECYDDGGKRKPILAIFYKVEPADVRWQINTYGEAMKVHVERYGEESEKVKSWRSALSRVCDLSGKHCRDKKYEHELIKEILKDASVKLPHVLLEAKPIVGLDSRFEEVKSLLHIDSNDTVRVLGIYGHRGIGKTTFAVHMNNKIRHRFQAASFIANIREKSSTQGLEDLQQSLLSEMNEKIERLWGNTWSGCKEIKRRLKNKRVLLVLDDVDDIEQLKSLAGELDWFGSGSRIIITTQDTTLLHKHNVEIKKYEMKELNYCDSLELFCWYAFDMSEPAEKFAHLCTQALSIAKGFPLELKVLGSNLKGLSVEEWEIELEKYEKDPDAFSFLVDSF